MDIGQKVELRLKELKKSKRQAAIDSGLSPTFVAEVCRGVKGLGIESARKLAPVLNWSVSELLGTDDQDRIESWFWSGSFGKLSDAELANLRDAPPLTRAAWSIRQVQAYFPDLNISTITNTPSDQIERILRGEGTITGTIATGLTAGLHLPPHWITLGEPGPSDHLVQKVLQHHSAAEWLELISQAVDENIPPSKIRKLMAAFVEIST